MLTAALTFQVNGELPSGGGRMTGLILLVCFLLSFGFIRMSTRLMRSPKVPWWPGSIKPGGLHIHHLVFGIVFILLAGFLEFAIQPGDPWRQILAGAFGIGAGLTLDEFALWLHLEDVYWAEEGRRSIDAVVVATIIGGCVVLGLAPLDSDDAGSTITLIAVVVFELLVCTAAVLKGKIWTGLTGFFIPPFAYVGAIRLAQPDSWWARRRYANKPDKLATSSDRAQRQRQRYQRWQDLIGGRPDG